MQWFWHNSLRLCSFQRFSMVDAGLLYSITIVRKMIYQLLPVVSHDMTDYTFIDYTKHTRLSYLDVDVQNVCSTVFLVVPPGDISIFAVQKLWISDLFISFTWNSGITILNNWPSNLWTTSSFLFADEEVSIIPWFLVDGKTAISLTFMHVGHTWFQYPAVVKPV